MKSYSQFELDLEIYQTYFKDKKDGIMIDIGAGWPEKISMSKLFRDLEWRVISFEPYPPFVQLHKKLNHEIYPYKIMDYDKVDDVFEYRLVSDDIETLPWSGFEPKRMIYHNVNMDDMRQNMKSIKVETYKLDTVLSKLKIDVVDYVSIDVEGWELNVLKGFDLQKYKPKVLVVENVLENEEYRVYMSENGYKFIKNVKNQDDVYIPKNL